MTRAQKYLLGILVLETVLVGVLWNGHTQPGSLPGVDWTAAMIEEPTVREIQALEGKLDRSSAAGWAELAATYRTFGLFRQAEYCYRQVDKLSPTDRSYLYFWAECFDLMGQTREASKRYRRIIREKLSVPLGEQTADYCWLNIGQDRLREENVPAAMEALRAAGNHPKAKFLLARILIRSGQAQEGSALLDQLLSQSPDVIEFNQMKSWAEAALGHQASALDFYERSLRASGSMPKWDPTFGSVQQRRREMGSQAWHEQSLQLKTQTRIPEALGLAQKALQAFWTEDRAQNVAELELLSGRFSEAISVASDCVRRAGASAKTLDIIGVASIQLGDRDRARKAWADAVLLEPTPNLYNKLSEMSRLAGNLDEARQFQGLAYSQTGKEAWKKNDLAIARDQFEKAVERFSGDASTWFYLAETRRLSGDAAGARDAYDRCLQINPVHGRAVRTRQRLEAAK